MEVAPKLGWQKFKIGNVHKYQPEFQAHCLSLRLSGAHPSLLNIASIIELCFFLCLQVNLLSPACQYFHCVSWKYPFSQSLLSQVALYNLSTGTFLIMVSYTKIVLLIPLSGSNFRLRGKILLLFMKCYSSKSLFKVWFKENLHFPLH